MTRFYIFFFTVLTLFSLYATVYGSVLDKVSYHQRSHSHSSSSSHTSYSSSARSSSSSHSYGNGGYSSGK